MVMEAARWRDVTRFCVVVYLLAALLIDAAYQLHLSIGGTRITPLELWSTFFFFSIWTPLIPLIVTLAARFAPVRGRRLRAFEVHFCAALLFSFLTLLAHKLVFCPRNCYLGCVTYYGLEAWMFRWFALDFFIYGAVAGGIWLAAIVESMRSREVRASAIERDLASAELRLTTCQVRPAELIDMFRSIASRVRGEPAHAEHMVTLVADFLRLNLRAVGASDLTVADDIDLLRAWLEMERERTGMDAALEVDVDDHIRTMPIAIPRLQASVAAAIRSRVRRLIVRVSARDGRIELATTADGIEILRQFGDATA